MKALRKSKRELFKEKLYEKKYALMKSGQLEGPTKKFNKKNAGKELKARDNKEQKASDYQMQETADIETQKPVKTIVQNSVETLDLAYDVRNVYDDHKPEESDSTFKVKGITYKLLENDSSRVDSDSEEEKSMEVKETNDTNMELSNNDDKHMELSNNDDKQGDSSLGLTENTATSKLTFVENNLMTCVNGYWIKRSSIGDVDKMKNEKIKEIIAQRDNGDESRLLNAEEDAKLKVS